MARSSAPEANITQHRKRVGEIDSAIEGIDAQADRLTQRRGELAVERTAVVDAWKTTVKGLASEVGAVST